MIRLRFRTEGRFMVGLGILTEAGIAAYTRGANEVDVADGALDALNDEQRAELVKTTRDPIAYTDDHGNQVVQASPDGMVAELVVTEAEAVHPPVTAEGTQGQAVTWVGEQPPRTGPGSGRDTWAAFATANDIEFTATAGRDDIIRAVEARGDR